MRLCSYAVITLIRVIRMLFLKGQSSKAKENIKKESIDLNRVGQELNWRCFADSFPGLKEKSAEIKIKA